MRKSIVVRTELERHVLRSIRGMDENALREFLTELRRIKLERDVMSRPSMAARASKEALPC